MRRRSVTVLPLILAALFAAYQYFGADKVTNPETGRAARVAMSPEQEETHPSHSARIEHIRAFLPKALAARRDPR